MDAAFWNLQESASAQNLDEYFQQFFDTNGTEYQNDPMLSTLHDNVVEDGSVMVYQASGKQSNTRMGETDTSMDVETANSAILSQLYWPLSPREHVTETGASTPYLLQQSQRQEQHVAHYVNQPQPVFTTHQHFEMLPASDLIYSSGQSEDYTFGITCQRNEEQHNMASTSLGTPAGTSTVPCSQMSASGLTVHTVNFFPLISPASNAQSDQGLLYDQLLSSSAYDLQDEMAVETTIAQLPVAELPVKACDTNTSRATAKARVQHSPTLTPRRERATSTLLQVFSETRKANEDELGQTPESQETALTRGGKSGNPSILAKNMSNMSPPLFPQPEHQNRSLFIQPQPQPQSYPTIPADVHGEPSPSAPATLIKLTASSANNSTRSNAQELRGLKHMKFSELPESVNFSSSFEHSDLDMATPIQSRTDPRSVMSSSMQSLGPPAVEKLTATAASASPNAAAGSTGIAAGGMPHFLDRGSKSRRTSVSPVHASSALKQRSSPSIKPLLPGTPGGYSAQDTVTDLLASKSNYQNILEGNTVPGVTYPSEMSTNLTLKRASHKLAEQGRRNRFNLGLEDMASLLPHALDDSMNGENDEKTNKSVRVGGASNSKANIVELALGYIKQLKKEVADANKRAVEAENKLGLGRHQCEKNTVGAELGI
ncbi:Putative myc-type, basic helix-loop-helix (bHLH) domain-containing protein [Colletotrichum destructivum]|uniref:Myc-type, basic helix-loop-helix (BHLH) domain-containing protein n=1 Tax=Colletotrichum destructivum TaxID=34406 RepID=A0AAX4I226_9PEZI|nr:Putative myc-type, basic helix-loop-helix (bHLH) domain-containing protein [Colletotrichum destructivum]